MNKFMKLFNKKENRKISPNKGTGNDIIKHLALQKALEELEAERKINESLRKDLEKMDKENEEAKSIKDNYNKINEKYEKIKTKKYNYDKYKDENKNLKGNLEVMINSCDKIKEICKESKTSKIAKAILKELGE